MLASYHNHTSWSDGTTPIASMVEGARRLGLDVLGISDHFVIHPTGQTPSWSMPPERLPEYVAEVRSAARSHGVRVVLGLEVDWFPERADTIEMALNGYEYDYLIGAVHEVDDFVIDGTADVWDAIEPEERDDRHRRYWQRVRGMAESGLFDIAAHIDLSKKFGHRPATNLDAEIDAALDAIAASDMVVELNTAGWHKPCAEQYPTLDILRRAKARGIRATLSADAHEPDHVQRDFGRGAEVLREAGFTEIARFEGRKRSFDAL